MKFAIVRISALFIILVGLIISAGCGNSQKTEYELTKGWHNYEKEGSNWLRWTSGKGEVRITVPKEGSISLQGEIISIHPHAMVDVLVNGQKVKTWDIVRTTWEFKPLEPLAVSLKAGSTTIEFVSLQPAVINQGDPRPLAVAFKNLRLTYNGAQVPLKLQ
ncbi:MAG: hypothetical protein M0Z79_11260 [Nitrospiraceae bacterium]|nr:hypothetical protein [Nitrospiraceae bacterium]